MKDICDIMICTPSDDTPRVQEVHILVGHIICQLIEQEMFPDA
jgi:D-sedoheptulose 7-phosphate isomerase